MFPQSVIERMGSYVYFLRDPRTGEVFYIGKGRGNRIFDHLSGATDSDIEAEKLDKIREITSSGNEVQHYVLRHGLTDEVAFEIEASLIDFVGVKNLSNLQNGHSSSENGLKTSDEIIAMYNAEDLVSERAIMLINLNQRYNREMTDSELYEATRQAWVLGKRRERAKYAIPTYRGLTREVYEIHEWFPIESGNKIRWGFVGCRASDEARKELRYKSISSYFSRGNANPIKYVNC